MVRPEPWQCCETLPQLSPGEVVLRTGEVDQCLYLVVKGKVNVYLTNDRKEVPSRACRKGGQAG